jgi:hypothetical protein
MRSAIIPVLALSLGACVSGGGGPPPAPLAYDAEQPLLALFEHVLTGHFAAAGADPPTTCAVLRSGRLSAEQEQALISRFVRLAPASRCAAEGEGWRDTRTGAPAQVIEVYDFVCREPLRCTGWAIAPLRPATRYAMHYEDGAWRFTADLRMIAG